MRKVDIAFMYEHAARELDVACAVAAGLGQAGLRVEILHWPTGFPQAVLQIQPAVVVLPFCYTEESFEALLAYWRTAKFFNMTWEQLFYLGNQKAKTPRGRFATGHVMHHAWSELYQDFLLKNGIPSEQIVLNGQPAYTLYDEPYCRFFPTKAELAARYGLDPNRRWVLFPENYNWAFYSQTTLERFIQKGQSPEDVQAMRAFCDRSLQTVLQWCARAVQEDDVELILRPRPSTTVREFEAFTQRVLPQIPDHLHILQKESVREWILASQVVVSSHSTSLIEAAVAGKRAYILEPHPIPVSLQVDWHKLLPHLKSEQDFIAICTGDLAIPDERLANWARGSMMGQGDAIHNLAETLAAIVRGEVEMPPPAPREVATPRLKFIPPTWSWSIYRRIKQWARYRAEGGIEPEFVKDVVPHREIEKRISRWASLLVENQI